ncbi:hypothetical protein T11_9954 [Trichinella zimbabwensis]|uniref:Uncharacterized protein n=1 Tax=Trichinella zimbabwensis TaxID=268475 RepID=A0A0V1GKK9_9BILA|nr:hypothetical protein T11_3998 [Trichinella zimbabwensis]KRY99625.1 hypothetical protein T11_9954 [Trichinella zimbabwensis]
MDWSKFGVTALLPCSMCTKSVIKIRIAPEHPIVTVVNLDL